MSHIHTSLFTPNILVALYLNSVASSVNMLIPLVQKQAKANTKLFCNQD